MNEAEFGRWLKDFCTHFPGVASYAEKLPDFRATKAAWYKCLKAFDLAILATVTDRITSGVFEAIKPADYCNFAVQIRKLANAIYDELHREDQRERWRAERSAWQEVTQGSMREMYLACCAAIQLSRAEEYDRATEAKIAHAAVVLVGGGSKAELGDARSYLASRGISEDDIMASVNTEKSTDG